MIKFLLFDLPIKLVLWLFVPFFWLFKLIQWAIRTATGQGIAGKK